MRTGSRGSRLGDGLSARAARGPLALVAALALGSGACTGGPGPAASGQPTASVSDATATPSATGIPGPSASGPASASPAPSEATIVLYFGSAALDPCTDVVPVERVVDEATPEAALRALLKGPTSAETAAGYQSWFSSRTADALASVTVVDGIARVSFHDLRAIIPNASSSCGSGMLLNELDSTLGQFPELIGARYSIEGDEAAFYEWLQRGVPEG